AAIGIRLAGIDALLDRELRCGAAGVVLAGHRRRVASDLDAVNANFRDRRVDSGIIAVAPAAAALAAAATPAATATAPPAATPPAAPTATAAAATTATPASA